MTINTPTTTTQSATLARYRAKLVTEGLNPEGLEAASAAYQFAADLYFRDSGKARQLADLLS